MPIICWSFSFIFTWWRDGGHSRMLIRACDAISLTRVAHFHSVPIVAIPARRSWRERAPARPHAYVFTSAGTCRAAIRGRAAVTLFRVYFFISPLDAYHRLACDGRARATRLTRRARALIGREFTAVLAASCIAKGKLRHFIFHSSSSAATRFG